jgi:hypothetical protein
MRSVRYEGLTPMNKLRIGLCTMHAIKLVTFSNL